MIIEAEIAAALPKFKLWIENESHLPKIEPIVLKACIKFCDGDLEKAKKIINLQYKLRNSYSNIFIERDFSDDIMQSIYQTCDIITLPRRTTEGNRITILRLADFDTNKLYFTEAVRLFFMVADTLMSIDDNMELPNSEIIVIDMTGFNLSHLKKVNLLSLKVFATMIQECYLTKIHSIHVLNTASYIDKVMFVAKPFIKKEYFKLIHFHSPNSDTIYSTIPKDLLPIDYGGTNGLIKDLKNDLYKTVQDKNGYLNDLSYWKYNEKKHSDKLTHSDIHILKGSFKALDID